MGEPTVEIEWPSSPARRAENEKETSPMPWKRPPLALVAALLTWSPDAGAEPLRYLEQSWSDADRQDFYSLPQGSQIMPYHWFRALERADGTAGFFADGLARHGYLPRPAGPDNPDGLPIGFAIDKDRHGWWIGMTCAACHTGQIEHDGTSLRIDGGPTQASFYDLLTDIRDALAATVAERDGAKFARFAARVPGAGASERQADRLFDEVSAFSRDWRGFVEASTTPVPWGRARLDAFGMIFNRVSSIDLGEPDNSQPPDAPVSYPFLWGASWHDKVQWNGSADNAKVLDRLGRNVGEVLGVFAKVELVKPRPFRRFYRSSADRPNLLRLELLLRRLSSPVWPQDLLGAIDQDKAATGKALFEAHCVSCHTVVAPGRQDTPVTVEMTPIATLGTDDKMAANACRRTVTSGRLAGAKLIPFVSDPLPDPVRTLELVAHVVGGAILEPPAPGDAGGLLRLAREKADDEKERALSRLAGLLSDVPSDSEDAGGRDGRRDEVAQFIQERTATARQDCGPDSPLMRYKGRPLDGIWATAPYLHNGSVASLYEILLPPEERPASFHVGSREFDPERVGFVTTPSPDSTLFDTSLEGNSRLGHDYGNATLSEEQRWQLVEYMKGL